MGKAARVFSLLSRTTFSTSWAGRVPVAMASLELATWAALIGTWVLEVGTLAVA